MQLNFILGSEQLKSEIIKDKGQWISSFSSAVQDYFSNKKKVKTLSLFSGAGGMDIGFHDAGFDIVESVEIEKVFSKTLELNSGPGNYFESANVNCIDIKEFDLEDEIDLIIGGPPCQTFSAAGRRASGVAGTSDERGILFIEYVRLLRKLSPKGFVFENVYGIIGAQNGEAWNEIVQAFSELGYKLHYRILDAADYGVPQHRERLLIVGLKNGEYKFPRPTHGPDSITGLKHFSAEEALCNINNNVVEKSNLNGEFGHLLKDIPPGLNYSFYTEKLGHPNPIFAWRSKFSDFLYKADNKRPVRTIKAQGGQYTGPFHWESRPFTIPEFKRLQTFPDSYEIFGGKGKVVHQIGNSVPPQLSRILAISIKEQVFEQGSPVKLEYLSPSAELTFRKRKRDLTKSYAEKAKLAIDSLYGFVNSSVSKFVSASLSFNFSDKLIIEENDKGAYHGKITALEDEVNVRVYGKKGEIWKTLTISPVRSWSLTEKRITLSWNGEEIIDYVIAWKFLEFQLRVQNIKSDLVQLAGYYQYQPNIKIKWCDVSSNLNKDYQVLKLLTSNEFTRKVKDKNDIFNLIQQSENDPISFLRRLKNMGVDVRNSNTNSMIENGKFLIPYEFPTLYYKSVQINKEL